MAARRFATHVVKVYTEKVIPLSIGGGAALGAGLGPCSFYERPKSISDTKHYWNIFCAGVEGAAVGAVGGAVMATCGVPVIAAVHLLGVGMFYKINRSIEQRDWVHEPWLFPVGVPRSRLLQILKLPYPLQLAADQRLQGNPR